MNENKLLIPIENIEDYMAADLLSSVHCNGTTLYRGGRAPIEKDNKDYDYLLFGREKALGSASKGDMAEVSLVDLTKEMEALQQRIELQANLIQKYSK